MKTSAKDKYFSITMRVLFFLLLLIFAVTASAQVDWKARETKVVGYEEDEIPNKNVVVTGTIRSSTNSEPLHAASVSIDFFKFFDYTDNQGKYILELPPGTYKLTVRHVGMLPLYYNLRIYSSDVLDLAMTEGVVSLEEIVISARPPDANVKETIPGIAKLNVQEVKTLPTFMGEVDILKSIQTLPGVTSVGEGSSGFNVRGGRADQNLMLLDGAPIFNASHALGFVSGFNQDVINNFTLYKGNVPANFGGRASSVLDVTTRQGDFTKWKYQGGVGPISGRFLAEGPLKKDKTSLLVAARTSYSDWILRKVKNPDVKNSSLFFYDANLGIGHRFSPNSSLKVSAYSSRDYFRFARQFAYSWENYVANAEWTAYANRKISPKTLISYGQYKNTLIDPSTVTGSELSNKLNYFQLKEVVGYIPNEAHTVNAGFEVTGYFPDNEKLKPHGESSTVLPQQVAKNKGVETGIFINEDWTINERLGLSAGLRYSAYRQVGNAETEGTYGGLEPRISLRVNVTKQQSIKLGYNRMRQYIHLISNTTSPTPVDLWQVSTKYLRPQVADNLSFGYFVNLGDNMWETSAEVFYKNMNNLVEYKNFPSLYLNPTIETELLRAKGRAYGGELYLRKLKGWWKGWVSYTYSLTEVNVPLANNPETINNGDWYPSNYNKPHSFNLVVTRRGMRPNGGVSAIFTYNTGRPFTAIESSYFNGNTSVPVYSDRNKYKIPDYFRLDLSFTVGDVVKGYDDSLVFSLYNVFGRDNAYSVFYQRPADYFVPKPYKLSVLGAAMPSVTYNFNF